MGSVSSTCTSFTSSCSVMNLFRLMPGKVYFQCYGWVGFTNTRVIHDKSNLPFYFIMCP